MADLDLRAVLRAGIERTHGLLVNDLNAVGDDKLTACPGGVASNAVHIIAECAAVNGTIANYLKTGQFTRPTPEQRKAYFEAHTTKESVLSELEKQTQALLSAIDGLDVSTLTEMVPDTPLGPMPRFGVAQIPAMHMMYHDGQLNYIHMLHGDDQMHW